MRMAAAAATYDDAIAAGAALATPPRQSSSAADLFTLSPIAAVESFTLEMPPAPSPMDVDATSSASPAAAATARQHLPLLSVFDWDDTLCPSSWLHLRGALPPAEPAFSERNQQRLTQLESNVLTLLQRALAVGPVFIITAATLQWVDACAARFLPRVGSFLAQHAARVRVVSAREWFHQHVRREGDPGAWKLATFDALCAHLQLDQVHRQLQRPVDFVSIGDSVFERDACRHIERKAPTVVHSKTLKFVDRPSLQELLDQVVLTATLFERIRSHAGSLDLLITRNAHRQKGDPTLRIVQVDLSAQQPQSQDLKAAAATSAVAPLHAATARAPPAASFHSRSRVLHTAPRFAMDTREMGVASSYVA